ncbi:EAL domain-containing protein [Oceanispirochaeta crateris]|nr:EAL domain-containing protein [Oceanispirochaeta crateris]
MSKLLASIETILKRILIFVLPLLVLLNWGYQEIFDSQYELMLVKNETRQREIIAIIDYHLNKTFESLHTDLNLIKNSDEFQDYLSNPNAENYNNMLQMFARVAKSKSYFRQIRYLDASGMEAARVNSHKQIIELVASDKLQDKADRYYTKTLQNMENESLYISDFDLNIENGHVVIPYEPIVRFGTPVFMDGKYIGSIIINYDGLTLVNILEKYDSQPYNFMKLGLLDKNHLISLNILQKEGTGFIDSLLFSINENDDLYRIIREKRNNNVRESFMLENEYYYYSKIDLNDKTDTRFEETSGPWILISSFNIPSALEAEANMILKHPMIRFILLFLVFLFSLIIIIIIHLKEDEHMLLLASGYISESTHDGVIITDSKKQVIYCNKVFENTFGYEFNQIKGKEPKVFLNGMNNIDLGKDTKDGFIWAGNVWDQTEGGTFILKYLQVQVVLKKHQKPVYYIGIYSEAKANTLESSPEQKGALILKYLDDQLMSFINPLFNKEFQGDNKYAIITIKIYDYSNLRNSLTQSEESRFVSIISNVFKNILNQGGLVTAPTSTLFVLALPFSKQQKQINELMNEIDTAIASVRFAGSKDIHINYLSGIAISGDHGTNASELINHSFIALEALIKLKKSKYLIFDNSIFESVVQDRTIRDQIDNGFFHDEFSVVYQAQKDSHTLKTTGVEALVRWNNPTLGNISPIHFIPIMEESNKIQKLGRYILDIIINDFENALEMIPKDFKISINLSNQEFNDKTLISELIARIGESKLKPSQFCFEITETTLVENIEHTNGIIDYLHDNDIYVAIDDFGTGYSSLSYLKNLRSDKLKIDRMFIKDYPYSDDGTILKAIVSMAKEIGIKIIVEGVEEEEQLKFIQHQNCEEFQGYYGSKPVAFEEFLKIMPKISN